MGFWILKSEPSAYPFARLVADGRTAWTGIRNFQARNFLRAMKRGDRALFFHTGAEKAVVGVAKIVSGPAADPTAPGEDWTAVELAPVKALRAPVPLAALKASRACAGMLLLRQGRLSVGPVTRGQWAAILRLGKTRG